MMRVALGSDEEHDVVDAIADHLIALGHEVVRLAEESQWPEVGRLVGATVAAGEAERGIVCCWTGTGVSIAANKIAGIRCALCCDAETARGARRWNDANVLALSLRWCSHALVSEILDAFFSTDADADTPEAVARLEHKGVPPR